MKKVINIITVIVSLLFLLILVFCSSLLGASPEPFMGSETPKQISYRHVLLQAKEALDELEIPFFLSSGTCLGYARERDFMEHDYDIDIGIFEADYRPEIIDQMAKRGLILYRIYGSVKTGLELSFYLAFSSLRQQAKIDIFVHRDTQNNEEKTCWFSYNSVNDRKLQYCVSKFGLEEVDFLGLKVNVPNPLKQYLEDHYGKDWRIPKGTAISGLGEYRYDQSPKSIVNF